VGRIDYGRGDPNELHLMGLWDGLGEYDSQERRNAICRRQAQMLDEQIAEKHRREALKDKARKRELEEEREQFRPKKEPSSQATPKQDYAQWQPYQPYQPPAPQAPQFSVSPPAGAGAGARPHAFNMAQAARAGTTQPQMQQPSFLQQLHQQLLYQPLMQLPGLLAQPVQQQLPQLPALPKRSFWEVPSFQVPPRPAALPSLPQRAESVDSFRRDAEVPQPGGFKRPSASESPRRRRPNSGAPLIDIEAEWRAWEAQHQAARHISGAVTESSRESPVPMEKVEKSSSEQSGAGAGVAVHVPPVSRSSMEVPYAPPRVIPIVPPARTLAESYGAGKLMEELQKVKRSWNDEREQLRAESEALKRQALRLQTEQVAIPSYGLAGGIPPKVDIFSPMRTGALQQLPTTRRRDVLPVITLQEIKGTLRCLDAGGASLFLLEPEERAEVAGSPITKAGPLPEGATSEKCAGCDNAMAVDANFCGSCGTQRKELGKPARTPAAAEIVEETAATEAGGKVEKAQEDAGSRMENTMKSVGKEEDTEVSQFFSSLQYSDSSGRTPTTVADGRTQRRPSQGFGKVVDLGAELKSTDFEGEKLPQQPVSHGRTQDFLISALLNEETSHPGHEGVAHGKPPLAPGGKPVRAASVSASSGGEEPPFSSIPEGQALKAMS